MKSEIFEFIPQKPVVESDAVITSGFGFRTRPDGVEEFHNGIDIACMSEKHTLIYSVWHGTVEQYGFHAGWGWHVWIRDSVADNHFSVYMHMDRLSPVLRAGGVVDAGEQIGVMGNTGLSRGVHLHYSICPRIDLVSKEDNRYVGEYGIKTVEKLYKGA